jgi:hypothetical protein
MSTDLLVTFVEGIGKSSSGDNSDDVCSQKDPKGSVLVLRAITSGAVHPTLPGPTKLAFSLFKAEERAMLLAPKLLCPGTSCFPSPMSDIFITIVNIDRYDSR